jgi:hypothetical protein
MHEKPGIGTTVQEKQGKYRDIVSIISAFIV